MRAESSDLFQKEAPKTRGGSDPRPLAERMRPATFENFLGQDEILGEEKPLRREILEDQVGSLILWGPPGCGKTTLARLVSTLTRRDFVAFSAVTGGVKDVREVVAQAKKNLAASGRQTILFVDEVHRFNKAQQDAFLPHIEDGTLTLIGATTENPSFELNRSLLSRCRVLVLKPLSAAELMTLTERAWKEVLSDRPLPPPEVLQALTGFAAGDARRLLNAVEAIAHDFKKDSKSELDLKRLGQILNASLVAYDRAGEEHYNVISAFIKSLRGSDPDAVLHYLARMLEAGEDPRFIARRMIIFASEDIGNADPRALPLAIAAAEAFERVGMPEGWIPLAHAATYLASTSKSNAAYMGYLAAREDVKEGRVPPVPLHLRNAPTDLMRGLGYGKEYRYPHEDPGHVNSQTYLPEGLEDRRYYVPSANGLEEKIRQRLEELRALRGKRK